MAKIKIKTKIHSFADIKPKIWFTCHPDDFGKYFKSICSDIFNTHDCAIYYTEDMSEVIAEEDWEIDLGQNNLFVVPVTYQLLSDPNRAMNCDIRYAFQEHIPILPIMMEPGLESLYSLPENFGELHFLDNCSTDKTAIPYADKLKKYLDDILTDSEVVEQILGAFRSRIFLSYRKANRNLANKLMRKIHEHQQFQDVAIWYDEYLPLGEDFRLNIEKNLNGSDLFMLLVTQELLEVPNFVAKEEYPAAKTQGLAILPIQMEDVDSEKLAEIFRDIPACISADDDNTIVASLQNALPSKAEATKTPEHTYLLGVAYLNGIHVEPNRKRGMEMLSVAAEAGHPFAASEIFHMFYYGNGVKIDYQEAVKWGEKAVQNSIAEYGDDHMITRIAQDNLAVTYSVKGECKKALELHEKLYQKNLQSFGEDHIATNLSLEHLASDYRRLGNYQKALECHLAVYATRKKSADESHPAVLDSLDRIAQDYHDLGDYRKALNIQLKIYTLSSNAHGKYHIITTQAVKNAGEYMDSLSAYSRALPLKQHAASIYRHTYGEDNPQTLAAILSLAETYSNLGMYQEAFDLEKTVYEKRCHIYGKDHPLTLAAMNAIAIDLNNLGRYEQSRQYSQYAYTLYSQRLGEASPDATAVLCNLAISHQGLNQDWEALSLWKKIYRNELIIFGAEHPRTIMALGNLATSYSSIGNHKKSKILLEKVYALSSRVHGEKHHETLRAMINLASVYGHNGLYPEELEKLQQAYTLGCEILGEKHSDVLKVLFNISLAYSKMGEHQKAYDSIQKAYELHIDMMGVEHPFSKQLHHNMMLIHINLMEEKERAAERDHALKLRFQELRTQVENYKNVGNYRKALEIALTLYNELCLKHGEHDIAILQVLRDLSVIHQELEDYQAALNVSEKGYALSREKLGNAHPDTQAFAKMLISLYKKQGARKQLSELRKAIRSQKEGGTWLFRFHRH